MGEPLSIIGRSAAIERLRQSVSHVGSTDASVLIIGETGTGKELVARTIHSVGARATKIFLPVNMAALPSTLAESVLFGHEKGSFTGAESTQKGWCELADQGTLFLDEISEMDVQLQAKLLRFLQESAIQRVGSGSTRSVDVRVIAATNVEPQDAIDRGRLRADLYYRLNVVPIQVPALRERSEDVPELVEWFLCRMRQKYPDSHMEFSLDALNLLQSYGWPGNVRELENLVERLTVFSPRKQIQVGDLPAEILSTCLEMHVAPARERTGSHHLRLIDQVESEAINEALRKTNGNVVLAARLLGVGQATVYRKIKRYGIALDPYRNKNGA